ncbi:MAG TPA: c-type cytochrome [Noviherbaspirillum sp.]|nr:c-type cytochrome [Noviherbaspirillum sp.]
MTKQPLLAAYTLFSAAGLLLAGLMGSAPRAHAAPVAAGKQMQPAAIYHNYCSVCHGDKGDGKSRAQGSLVPPPKDFTNPGAAHALTREQMIEAVVNGKSGTAMTPWKSQLSQKEIEGVVDYIRTTFMPAASSDRNNRGRVVYAEYCSVCHGERGDARSRAKGSLMPPPRDFTAPDARMELTRERMIKSVTYGRPETAMVGFKSQLNDKDIQAVVDYIRSGFMAPQSTAGISGTTSGNRGGVPAHAAMPQQAMAAPAPAPKAAPVNMNAPMPKGLKGDPIKGAAFYMSNCSTCHGATGDGRGPRAYFILPKPRNFLHDASRADLNRPAIFKATTEGKLGSEMPAWGKVMTDQEIADVAEFVFQRFIRQSETTKAAK